MEPVTTTTATTTAAPTSGNTPVVPDSSDFETYLQMLTVQLNNQDPLNPMEADEFAVQLATFSMVEQQTLTNTLLETVVGQLGQTSLAQMSAWVGMEARGAFPVQYSGAPVTLHMPYAVVGEVQELVVTDADGEEVARIPVEGRGEVVTWDGTDKNGTPVEEGVYSFRIDSLSGDELVGSGPVESYALVTEVRMTDDGMRLVTPGDIEVDPNKVAALRTAEGDPVEVF